MSTAVVAFPTNPPHSTSVAPHTPADAAVAAPGLATLAYKAAVVHTVTYFLAGLVAMTAFNYEWLFALPEIANLMRPVTDPWVAAGPLVQPLRGLVFALPLWLLGQRLFTRWDGWLVTWVLLVCVGILATFGPAPGSIEGVMFTRLPLWFHLKGLPEVLGQSLVFALVLWYWVRHPQQRWLGVTLGVIFVLAMALSGMGLLMALRAQGV